MRPVFADPKTDFVFKKLFGTEDHKDLLIALLNALLGLTEDRGIVDVTFLRGEERPPVRELKFSVVDVKCRDARGRTSSWRCRCSTSRASRSAWSTTPPRPT